jgi:hypothetical protein
LTDTVQDFGLSTAALIVPLLQADLKSTARGGPL